MWILVSKHHPESRHILLCNRDYVLGRRDADILLENDMSISRKHAVLHATHPEPNVINPAMLPVLTVQDLSKLGTAVGEKRFVKTKGIVSSNDLVWFGNLTADNSKYTAVYETYMITTSCLDAAAKKSTRQLLMRLGGHVINDWRKECDVLVMSNLSITIKAICALIGQKPIVKPQYLVDYVQSLEQDKPAPNPHRYLPPLAESQLDPKAVSFAPDPRRTTLFQGSLFIFLTAKQFKKLSPAIEAGGGMPMLLEQRSDDSDDQLLIAPGSCVMSCDLNDQSQPLTKDTHDLIEHVLRILQKHEKRAIQESEIGFAVLYCSTATHCNPGVNIDNGAPSVAVVPQTLSQVVGSIDPHIDTQHRDRPLNTMTSTVASERNESETVSFSSGRKRGRGEDTAETTPAKRTRGVKHEPVTPLIAHPEHNNNVKPDSGNTGRKTRSSPTPESNQVGTKRSLRNRSPSPVAEPLRRSTRRSPSPKPPSPKQPRGSARRSHSPAAVSPDPVTSRRSPVGTSRRTAPVKDDLFDDIPCSRSSRGGRTRTAYSSDEGVAKSDPDDEFAAIPRRKARRKRERSVSPDTDVVDIPRRTVKPEPNVTVIEDTQSTLPPAQRPPLKHEQQIQIKPEPQSQLSLDPGPSHSQRSDIPDPRPGRSIDGFVTRQNREDLRVDDAYLDKDIKPIEMAVEERSLMVRQPGQGPRSRPNMAAANLIWNGKPVKNFKKFKKVDHAGSHVLPEIIGGTDLVTHINSQRQELDDWFNEYLDRESQQKEQESQREADDLEFLNYGSKNSSARPKKGRR